MAMNKPMNFGAKREIWLASERHEIEFREAFELRAECKDDPECQAAFEYAATHRVWPDEMAYIGRIIVRKPKE